MKIELPKKVLFIINNLQLHGYEAFAVGGCVRDSILARRPQDWDITTSAKPEEIKKLFRRTIDTGIEHGTVTVLFGKDSFEVTTYRIDGAYEDSRHPKEVQFTNRLEEDHVAFVLLTVGCFCFGVFLLFQPHQETKKAGNLIFAFFVS